MDNFWCLAKLMTELYSFVVRIRKSFPEKASMIARAVRYGFGYLNGVYESICTVLLANVSTETGILDIDSTVVTLATCTICNWSSAFTTNTLPPVTLMSLVIVWYSIDSVYYLNWHRLRVVWKYLPVGTGDSIYKLVEKWCSKEGGSANFFTISSSTRTRVYPMHKWSIIVPTTSTFWLVPLRSRIFCWRGLRSASRCRPGSHLACTVWHLCHKTQVSGRIRDLSSQVFMAAM